MNEREYWLGFSVFPGIGPFRFKKILEEFGTAKKAWSCSNSKILKILGESLGPKFVDFASKFSIENYLKSLKKENVWFLTLKDKHYPNLLSKIKNPPFVLYGRGIPFEKWEDREINRTIAVVGARKTTAYGREVTRILASQLSLAGFTIVSGLAIGVDAVSHRAALDNGGKTIAVLGCGVDCCNPTTNKNLYSQIIKNGCVVSEVPLSKSPSRGLFPARNRIITGLSLGVLVTEGGEDSGSLITADYALSFSRRVFAVPGPITSSLSKGPFSLIQKGAKLVINADDVLDELKITNPKSEITNTDQKRKLEGTGDEKRILRILENESLHFDEIVRRSQLDSSKIGSLLSIMEIKGMVKSLESGIFAITS